MTSPIEMPQVTIVVPVYNGEDYIEEALDSLLAQDYSNIEIIVVDDGSSDETAEILARYADRMTIIKQLNAGQSAALTNGWGVASGELIGYLSADDRLAITAVSECASALRKHPEAALAYPDFHIINELSQYVSVVRPQDYSSKALYADLVCLPGPGALFRKSAYEQAGPWRADLRQIPDLDFFLRLALHGDFLHVGKTLADFRRHTGSTTYRKAPFERGEEPEKMLDAFFENKALPAQILAWRAQSYANALLLAAMIHGGSGRRYVALGKLISAFGYSPRAVMSKKGLAAIHLLLRGRP